MSLPHLRNVLRSISCVLNRQLNRQPAIIMKYHDATEETPLQIKRNDAHATCIVRVVNGGCGSGVVIQYGTSRYIFNTPESIDRCLKEYRWNTSSLKSIFFTHLRWRNLAGLASLAMSIQTKGMEHLSIHGPIGAHKLLDAAAGFVKLHNITLDFNACNPEEPYHTNRLRVEFVILKDSNPIQTRQRISYTKIDYYNYERKKSMLDVLGKVPDGEVDRNTSVAYICYFKEATKLSLSKCVDIGLQPGSHIYDLLQGKDIVLESGTTVKSSDVMEKEKFSTVVVIDCPNKRYLESLLQSKGFDSLKNQGTVTPPTVIIHFSPVPVMTDKRYIKWMQEFPINTKHLLVNESSIHVGFATVVERHNTLHQIHPQIFPSLKGIKIPSPTTESCTNLTSKELHSLFFSPTQGTLDKTPEGEYASEEWLQTWKKFPEEIQLIEARSWTCIDLMRCKVLRFVEPHCISRRELGKHKNEIVGIIKKFEDSFKTLATPAKYLTRKLQNFPIITFLGTGAQSNNSLRNTSGILCQLSEHKAILLDCGEGTLGQLKSFFDSDQLQKILCSLSGIYISHLHGDHHLGLFSLLQAHKEAVTRAGNPQQKLLLLAPLPLRSWLSFYHHEYEAVLDNTVHIPLNKLKLDGGSSNVSDLDALIRDRLDMDLICTCEVKHCSNSYGVSLLHSDGWKLTYSGDTMYCPDLAKIGKNSDILIHEATFNSTLHKMAVRKCHSTIPDALKIAKLMKAKNLILTHFSQRFPQLPDMRDLQGASNVAVAFDFMTVKFKDLPTAYLLNEVYRDVYRDELEEIYRYTDQWVQ